MQRRGGGCGDGRRRRWRGRSTKLAATRADVGRHNEPHIPVVVNHFNNNKTTYSSRKNSPNTSPPGSCIFLHVPPILLIVLLTFFSPAEILPYCCSLSLLASSPCPICIFETRHLSDLTGALQSPGQTTHPLRIYISKHVTRSESILI